ncbi:MAG: hypothetical protein DRH07_00210 [Deltaproteobacteria bacterium]|nr:MAG: hypothetical protein DRH07_00210 [Deltaproteobacteria bacterium]
MATAKDFVERVSQIAGVAGCLLIRSDGMVVDQTSDDVEGYSSLLQISSGLAADIMNGTGFSHCRYINFQRTNNQSFYIFPIDQYLLGIIQQEDCSVNEMLEQVFSLLDKVSTNRG